MTDFMYGFATGFLAGAGAGFLIMAMLVVASMADDQMEDDLP